MAGIKILKNYKFFEGGNQEEQEDERRRICLVNTPLVYFKVQ